MGSLFGGGGGSSAPPPAPMPVMPEPAKVEPPIVMPVKDPVADTQYAMKEQVQRRAGKTSRSNTIIGDSLGDG